MPHLAYLLIGDPDPDMALSRAEHLSSLGYRCIQASDAHALIGLAGSRMPDLVLLGAFPPPTDGLAIAQALKTADATQSLPVVLLDLPRSAMTLAAARDAGVDDILTPEDGLDELAARLPRLTRTSVMTAELGRRIGTAAQFGVDVDPRSFKRPYPEKPQVMAIAQDGATLASIEEALNAAGIDCAAENSTFRAADGLDGGRFDAAVIAVGPDQNLARVHYLCGHIRNNPRLFNLPTLVVLPEQARQEDGTLYRGGAAIILYGTPDASTLRTYLHMLVTRQRLRWTMRDPFKATLRPDTSDSTGAAYSQDFWDAHLARCFNDATERGSNLAVGYLSVPSLPRVREEFGEENAEILAHQLADWITGMTRIEDTVARVGDDAFAVLLPDTPEAEANRVIQRIVGILHSSEFHLGEEVMQIVHAWVEGGVSGMVKDDTPDDLFRRARDSAL